MPHNYCIFCGCEIPGHLLACDNCRPEVEKLDSEKQKLFKAVERDVSRVNELFTPLHAAFNQLAECIYQILLPCATFTNEALKAALPRVRHLALYGKKERTRKKNINRALREYQKRREHENTKTHQFSRSK